MDNTYEWVVWQWANAKMKKQSPYITKKRSRPNSQPIKQDIKNYHWVMFKHIMEFLNQRASLKKSLPKYYFTSILKELSTKNLITFCELLAKEIAKPQQRLYATPCKQS
jgi:hypothetical protein